MIPIIDFNSNNSAEDLRNACLNHGFFYLKAPFPGYFGDFSKAKDYFAKSLEEKLAHSYVNSLPKHIGYVPFDEEDFKEKTKDQKESFDFEALLNKSDSKYLPKGLEWVKRYHDGMSVVSLSLRQLTAESLGLDSNFFESFFNPGVGYFRMLHYPATGKPVGCGEHTDYGFMTLLNQDSIGGLQIYFKDKWVDVEPIKDTIVVNIGDLLSAWTNGEYKSTLHRVVHQKNTSRYSIPFFMNPDPSAYIVPMVKKGETSTTGILKAGDYIQGRYDSTFKSRETN